MGYYYTSKEFVEKLEFDNWVKTLESDPKFQAIANNYNLNAVDRKNSSTKNLTSQKNMI